MEQMTTMVKVEKRGEDTAKCKKQKRNALNQILFLLR